MTHAFSIHLFFVLYSGSSEVLRFCGSRLPGSAVQCPPIIARLKSEDTMTTYLASETRYQTMRYNRCGRSGLKLPAISLGLWHNFGGVDRVEQARAMLLRAFDLGITHFDLANNYGPPPGSAEETL